LKKYYFIGGMPEAILAYREEGDFMSVRKAQKEILKSYDKDFAKHSEGAMLEKIRLLWNSIPSQLAKENKKFVYTALKSGARAREYESALQWLDDAGMIRQVFRVGTPRIPLRSYIDLSAFKLYAHDVGLLGALSELPPSAIVEGNALFTNFKGALTEQYVLQELLVAGYKPAYWTNDAGNAEVEFVIQGDKAVYPVEAKAGINTQAKSLKVYQNLFSPPFAIRTSLADANDGNRIKDIPLYAFGPSVRQWILKDN
jgi:predicted AAA+ superfamily ATPase